MKIQKGTNREISATPLATMTCSLPCDRGFESTIRKPTAVDTTSMGNSNLGGITVFRETRISSWFGGFVTDHTSPVNTVFFPHLILRPNAQILRRSGTPDCSSS